MIECAGFSVLALFFQLYVSPLVQIDGFFQKICVGSKTDSNKESVCCECLLFPRLLVFNDHFLYMIAVTEYFCDRTVVDDGGIRIAQHTFLFGGGRQ